jgi:SOS-response transcriptional repressor LexA
MTNVDTRAALVLYPHAHCEVWEVRDNAVLLLGYAPGDRILVDPKAVPMLGDVVIATIADRQIGLGETMLRLYRPPFLVPASIDPRLQPCALADGAVTIKGVVVAQYRLTAHTRPTENYQAA